MISMCPHCGSNRWDKTATDTQITCPNCGQSWPYRRGALYLLTGCSGVGKTTTAIQLFRAEKSFAVLDGDMFYIPSDDQLPTMLEKVLNLTAAFNQAGKPILWTLTGGLELLPETYHYQFISSVHCLALTSEPAELHRRMTEGRGISDSHWLDSSQEYNDYFRTHHQIGDIPFDALDVTHLTPDDVAAQVLRWMQERIDTPCK